MSLLKKDNWLVCLFLMIFSQGLFAFVLAYFMKLYDKNAWYTKWQYWVFGALCCFFPIFIMFIVFNIQINVKLAESLGVKGKEIYTSPYAWILCLIVPVVGWSLLFVMMIYIEVFTIIELYKGSGEKYIN